MFFSKTLFDNFMRFILKIIKFKTLEKSNFNFMKHKLIFVTVPLMLLTGLMSIFIFDICSDKFDLDGLFENSETVINLPVDKDADIDSATLNEIQQTAHNLLNCDVHAQFASKYSGFVSEVLNKTSTNEIKITTNKNFSLTEQQKESLFNELKMKFPNLIKLNSSDEIGSYNLSNSQKKLDFWLQFSAAAAILILMLLIYFGFKFKKIGFWSAILVALINLLFSITSTFLLLVIFTKKINLTCMVAMSFYFSINLTALFNEIKNQLPKKIKINEANAAEVANISIQKTVPSAVFVVSVLFVALVFTTIFCVIFNNYFLLRFAFSSSIAILMNLLFNLFCNGQIWAILKHKKLKEISQKEEQPTKN